MAPADSRRIRRVPRIAFDRASGAAALGPRSGDLRGAAVGTGRCQVSQTHPRGRLSARRSRLMGTQPTRVPRARGVNERLRGLGRFGMWLVARRSLHVWLSALTLRADVRRVPERSRRWSTPAQAEDDAYGMAFDRRRR